MPFPGLQPSEMHLALDALNQALANHDRWHEELTRTLICRLPPDQRDTEDDAHRHCRFGQWLYGPGNQHLGQHPALKEIESAHMRMHRCAREVLLSSASGEAVPQDHYERFVNALKQLRLEVTTTKHELEDALYNVDPLSGASNRIGMLTKLREQQALVQRKLQSCVAGKQGALFQITASFGVTLLDPDVSVEQSIERADKALYAAKAAGRDKVMIWDSSMS